jgi:hypothetical protein
MEMLSARPRASTIRCEAVDNSAIQTQRDHAIVAQLPDLSLWIPPPAGLLHLVADCYLGKGDA